MSIKAKHAYRFGFLKSEKWQTFRLAELVKEDGKCNICGRIDSSNDIHHVCYPDRWDETKSKHVVVLCPKCHERVHFLTDGIKFETDGQRWKHFKLVAHMFVEEKKIQLTHISLCV